MYFCIGYVFLTYIFLKPELQIDGRCKTSETS